MRRTVASRPGPARARTTSRITAATPQPGSCKRWLAPWDRQDSNNILGKGEPVPGLRSRACGNGSVGRLDASRRPGVSLGERPLPGQQAERGVPRVGQYSHGRRRAADTQLRRVVANLGQAGRDSHRRRRRARQALMLDANLRRHDTASDRGALSSARLRSRRFVYRRGTRRAW